MAQEANKSGTDISTGQHRRTPIEWRIDQIIEQIQLDGEGIVSVVYLDIDGFGLVEQEYGFKLADALLESIAKHLRQLDEPDFSERYVRDSFLIVYNNLTLEEAFLSSEQLRSQLSQTTFSVIAGEDSTKQQAEIQVSFSAGVSTFPGEPEGRQELINLAEEASRRALAAGGSRTNFGRAVNMTPKTSHYSPDQLTRLKDLRNRLGRSEASLLREALDDLLRKYDQRDIRRFIPWMSPARKKD
jgi:diguanylate cyclase (GGDEF)-like protein